jgi:hypothetical protein
MYDSMGLPKQLQAYRMPAAMVQATEPEDENATKD